MASYYLRDLPVFPQPATMPLSLAKYLGGGYQPRVSPGASPGLLFVLMYFLCNFCVSSGMVRKPFAS